MLKEHLGDEMCCKGIGIAMAKVPLFEGYYLKKLKNEFIKDGVFPSGFEFPESEEEMTEILESPEHQERTSEMINNLIEKHQKKMNLPKQPIEGVMRDLEMGENNKPFSKEDIRKNIEVLKEAAKDKHYW